MSIIAWLIVVTALSTEVNDVVRVARALWHNWNGTTIHLTDLANALWHNWHGGTGFQLGNLWAALSNLDNSVVDVVGALSSEVNDVGQVAIPPFGITGMAPRFTSPIWPTLFGTTGTAGTGYQLGNLSAALSSVDDSVFDVTGALSYVVDDLGQVISAVWNNWDNSVNWNVGNLANSVWFNWQSSVNWNAGNLVNELMNICGVNLVNAWQIVNGL